MGGRSSPLICQKSTNCIRHFMRNIGYIVYNYIDDFMSIDYPYRIQQSYVTLGNLPRDLGVQEAMDKAVPPTTVLELLGVLFDLIRQILILPQDKLKELKCELKKWQQKQFASKKELQQIAGKLQFASICIRPGRVFTTRLFQEIGQMNDHENRQIKTWIRQDLYWWSVFLDKYNGVSMMWLQEDEEEVISFATDASLTGIAGFKQGQYYKYCVQGTQYASNNIAHLEMLALVVALKLWINELKTQKIYLHCDNMNVIHTVNGGKCRDKIMQKYLREIAYVLAINQSEIKLKYIKSECNIIPDILSRYTDATYRTRFNNLLQQHPDWMEKKVEAQHLNNTYVW